MTIPLGPPKFLLYAETGPLADDFFTAQAWSDEDLQTMLGRAEPSWTVTVYTQR